MDDLKMFSMLCLGLVVGMFLGYTQNTEKTADLMAQKICAVDKENLAIMIGNYNTVARQCNKFDLGFNTTGVDYNATNLWQPK